MAARANIRKSNPALTHDPGGSCFRPDEWPEHEAARLQLTRGETGLASIKAGRGEKWGWRLDDDQQRALAVGAPRTELRVGEIAAAAAYSNRI